VAAFDKKSPLSDHPELHDADATGNPSFFAGRSRGGANSIREGPWKNTLRPFPDS
jgi:hypothetical protein